MSEGPLKDAPPNHDDPETADLPPGAVLPDRTTFIRGQHLARGVTAMIALGLLIAFWAVLGRGHPELYATCSALVVISMLWHFYRYFCPGK